MQSHTPQSNLHAAMGRDNYHQEHPVFFLFRPTKEQDEQLRQQLDAPGHPPELEKANYYVPWPSDRRDETGTEEDKAYLARRMLIDRVPFSSVAAIFVDRQSLEDQKALIVQVEPFNGEKPPGEIIARHRFPLVECSNIVNCVNLAIFDLEEAIVP